MANEQSFKERYDIFVSELNSIKETLSNLNKRYQIYRRNCERNLFLSLFYKRRLRLLAESIKDLYTLFEEASRKQSFILGMISKAYLVDDPYIDKTINHGFEEINLLNTNLQQLDLRLQKWEKK